MILYIAGFISGIIITIGAISLIGSFLDYRIDKGGDND